MKNKKSQLSLFIVICLLIVILVSVLLYLFHSSTNQKIVERRALVDQSALFAMPVQKAIETCLSDSLTETVYFAGKQGGYLTFNNIDYIKDTFFKVPVYLDCGGNITPSISDIKIQLESATLYRFEACFQNLTSSFENQGIKIDRFQNAEIKISLNQLDVSISLFLVLDIVSKDYKTRLERFHVKINVPFRNIFDTGLRFINESVSQKAIDLMSSYFGYNLTKDCKDILKNNTFNIYVKNLNNLSDVVQIMDYQSKFVFQFGVVNMNYQDNSECLTIDDEDKDSVSDKSDNYKNTKTIFVDTSGADCSQKICNDTCTYYKGSAVCMNGSQKENYIETWNDTENLQKKKKQELVSILDGIYETPECENQSLGRKCNVNKTQLYTLLNLSLVNYGDATPEYHDECLRGSIHLATSCNHTEGENCSFLCCSSLKQQLYNYSIHRAELAWEFNNQSDDCKDFRPLSEYVKRDCSSKHDPDDSSLGQNSYESAHWDTKPFIISGDCGSLPYTAEVCDSSYNISQSYLFGPYDDKNDDPDCWVATKSRQLYFYDKKISSYNNTLDILNITGLMNLSKELIDEYMENMDLRPIIQTVQDKIQPVKNLCGTAGGSWFLRKELVGCMNGMNIKCNFQYINILNETCTKAAGRFFCDDKNIYCSR